MITLAFEFIYSTDLIPFSAITQNLTTIKISKMNDVHSEASQLDMHAQAHVQLPVANSQSSSDNGIPSQTLVMNGNKSNETNHLNVQTSLETFQSHTCYKDKIIDEVYSHLI